jgi:hypothetical protein
VVPLPQAAPTAVPPRSDPGQGVVGEVVMDMEREAQSFDGLFEGMLKPEEYEHLIKSGHLRRTYEGAAGFLGLAKLRVVSNVQSEPSHDR